MVGKYINNYEIDEIIDEGGMATVYLGINKILGRKAAVKMLNPILSKNPQYKQRFINEAKLLSRLNHPNIINLYDYVENDLGIFIITEFVKGQTLDAYVDLVSGPMPESKAIKIITQILSAVGQMHEKNIIHRDIKPSNIMITADNTIKLIDLGIAKHLRKNNAIITKDGSKLGTTIFMSPQQVKGKVLDRRTDIYSTGATLFYLLTGQYPYDKELSEYEIYNKIVTEPFPDPRRYYVGVSDKMCNIVSKATENQPLERYQSSEEFNIALQSTQIKKNRTATVSLQTKIVDAAEIEIKKPVFGNEFWQNMVMLLSAIAFSAVIITGLYFLSKKEDRHIIADNTFLLDADSVNASKTERLYYGEIVHVIKKPDEGIVFSPWFKVRSSRNNIGYVKEEDLETTRVFEQINIIFGNSTAGTMIPAKYKKELREYFIENKFYENNQSNWKLFAQEANVFEFNDIAFGFFDSNSIKDFACVLRNIKTDESKLIIFFDNRENISVSINEHVKIRTIDSGDRGGRWHLGKRTLKLNEEGKEYEVKLYETLKTDGILLYKEATSENILYVYNSEEKMINFFSQTK